MLGAAAGLHASAFDLQKILNATFIDSSLLSRSSLQILTDPYKQGTEYGFGCFNSQFKIAPNESINVIGHEGYIWGVSTAALYKPNEKINLILLSNKGFTANLESGLRDIISLLFNGEVDFPKIGLDNKLMQIKNEKDFMDYVSSLQKLEKLQENHAVREYDLNDLGYHLIGKIQYEKAEAVLKLNCRLFPKSSNSYDSLGEVQYLLKDYKNSLINYKKSLELDVSNENAEDFIREINELIKF